MYEHYLTLLNDLKIVKEEIPICIETGSHRGGGSWTFYNFFDEVFSIELSDSLFEHCTSTYQGEKLTFLKGASTDLLPDIVSSISEKYFLFLDAHGSGGGTTFDPNIGRFGSPVLQEIECVKDNLPEWLIVDDIRDFDRLETYPSREEIIQKVAEIGDYEEPIVKYHIEDGNSLHPQFFCFKKR